MAGLQGISARAGDLLRDPNQIELVKSKVSIQVSVISKMVMKIIKLKSLESFSVHFRKIPSPILLFEEANLLSEEACGTECLLANEISIRPNDFKITCHCSFRLSLKDTLYKMGLYSISIRHQGNKITICQKW